MTDNTNKTPAGSTINTDEFLAKVEEAAREGAKQRSKGRGGEDRRRGRQICQDVCMGELPADH